MARTLRVKRKSAGVGDPEDDWQVQISGRFIRSFPRKSDAHDFALVRANVGDELVVERRNGSIQKRREITSSNEDRLDMAEGEFSLF